MTLKFPSMALEAADRIEALEAENAALRDDAERYRWMRDEHYIINPVAAVVWKKNDDRSESEWVNTVDGYSLDCHIDAARSQS